MGELVAWIIGWDLMLEYAVGAATVAIAWSEYSQQAARVVRARRYHTSGRIRPSSMTRPTARHGIMNIPAVGILLS